MNILKNNLDVSNIEFGATIKAILVQITYNYNRDPIQVSGKLMVQKESNSQFQILISEECWKSVKPVFGTDIITTDYINDMIEEDFEVSQEIFKYLGQRLLIVYASEIIEIIK